MKKHYKFFGIIIIGAVIGLSLVGCKKDSCPNPNGTCWQRGGDDYSFCGQASCGLAYDYSASCNCGK
jgi:hypothetical protein